MSSPSEYYGDDFISDTQTNNIVKITERKKKKPTQTFSPNIDQVQDDLLPSTPVKIKEIKKEKDNNVEYTKLLGQIMHQQHSILTTLSVLTKKVSKIEKYIILYPLMNKTIDFVIFEKVKKEYDNILSSIDKIAKKNI